MEIVIRRATAADAEVVHKIVLLALRETNARDYPSSVIDRLVLTLPDKVASNLETWCAFVAIVNGRVVGTGSLSGQTVSSVYVHLDYQGRGIATKLMVWHCCRSAHEHRTKPPTAAHEGCCPSAQRRGEGRKGAGLLHAHPTPDAPMRSVNLFEKRIRPKRESGVVSPREQATSKSGASRTQQ
jgi:GNAT superfamily N-acetyltransferase